ncbi:MAG: MFS transporter [Planctomycetales bacterium]|nr:MFS transporter [Planctomycetales bacterium]
MVRAAFRRYHAAYRGLPRDVWLLAIVLFVNRSGTMVLPFLTLYLTRHLDFTEAAAGQMITVYGLGSIAGAYLGGRMSEKWGAFRVQTVCMALSVPLMVLLPFCSNHRQIAATLLLLAVIYEAVRPANATALAKVTTADTRTRAFALQRLAANLGFSFGPAIGGWIATIDFQLLFFVDAATSLLAAIALLYFFRMRRVENPEAVAECTTGSVAPLRDYRFVLFLALAFVTHVVFIQLLVTYPLYLRDHFELTKKQIGLMFAVNTSIIVLCEMVLIDCVKHWPVYRLIGWGSFLCCAGFGMLPFGSSGTYCVLAMIVLTVGEMLSFPTAAAYASHQGPPGSEARYLSWYIVANSLAWVVGPALGAGIYHNHREMLWLSCFAVGPLILAGYQTLAHTRQAPAPPGHKNTPI